MSISKKKSGQRIIICIASLLIVFIVAAMVCLLSFFHKDYYKIEPRVDKIKSLDVSDVNDFEVVGWLRIQGTSLDLPVVYSTSDNYSFPVDFDHYVWLPRYDNDKFHNMMTIFGHNIFNLSKTPLLESDLFTRFEELMGFVYYDFAKENKYFQFTFNDEDYVFKIFAVNFVPPEDAVYFPFDLEYTEKEMEEQIEYLTKNSLYHYDVDVEKTDKLISLVTCTRFFGSTDERNFYVTGRLLRKNEIRDDYSVTKNKVYEVVENKMKGDDKNEEA